MVKLLRALLPVVWRKEEVRYEPYKQVEVYQHEVVSILFVDPVMTNDARSSSLSSGISPSVNRTSQAEQRSQARMQTAMEQRKAVMQRRYDEQPETP